MGDEGTRRETMVIGTVLELDLSHEVDAVRVAALVAQRIAKPWWRDPVPAWIVVAMVFVMGLLLLGAWLIEALIGRGV